jgi:zinc transporter ZupT
MIIEYCRTVQHNISTIVVDPNNRRAISNLKATYLVACEFALHDFPERFAMTNAYSVAPSKEVMLVAP